MTNPQPIEKIVKNVLFCGMMKSPFILDDMQNLQSAYTAIDVFDITELKLSLQGILKYAILAFTTIPYKVFINDIVYLWFADYHSVPILFWSIIFGKPTILNIGGYEVSGIKEIGYGNQLSWFRGMVSRWCIRVATRNIVPSNAYVVKTSYIEPESSIRIVPNAIDTEYLCNIPIPEKELIAVTSVYNLERDGNLKGIPLFKSATENTPYKYKVIVGKPHDELIKELLKSKVYCQFSYTESCGVSLLEAMACGCVPVVFDVDDLPALVKNTGIVVPYGDIKESSLGIERAMTMDGNPARERARLFSKERKLEKLKIIIGD